MKYLYKYPQRAFPYEDLVWSNRQRPRAQEEYELLDTGALDEQRYFDVYVEYAKVDVEDICVRVSAINRGPAPAPLHLLPTLWFRNTWRVNQEEDRPALEQTAPLDGCTAIECNHPTLGRRWLFLQDSPELLFTENETNRQRLYGEENSTPYVKDGFDQYIVHGEPGTINRGQVGTKAAGYYFAELAAGGRAELHLRLMDRIPDESPLGGGEGERIFEQRRKEADEFYDTIVCEGLSEDARNVQRQALSGLLWSKQFYHYEVKRWLKQNEEGAPLPDRRNPRNQAWTHLYNEDSYPCPTSGNIPGTPPGTWPSTASPSSWWMWILPKAS